MKSWVKVLSVGALAAGGGVDEDLVFLLHAGQLQAAGVELGGGLMHRRLAHGQRRLRRRRASQAAGGGARLLLRRLRTLRLGLGGGPQLALLRGA